MFRKRELMPFPRRDRLDIHYISAALTKINPSVLKVLKTPNYLFSYQAVNLFINLVAATTEFDMVAVNFCQYPEFYPIHNATSNDVQILYAKPSNNTVPGHLMCIFYKADDRTIFVYDHQRLKKEQMLLIKKRYPNYKHVTYVDRKTKQQDKTSCGPFAIAYATSLILGHDPRTHKLRTNSILTSFFMKDFDYSTIFREHILKMFEAKQLLPFPQ
ncbi:uncharacterized protein LOC116340409 [Contarinia nasturtii]|uniref:uncharacterized protein LOC116340409 n=1 Tax=Contarinia nasturtii TaxID=265458 RepID=UPI0012D3DA56|nr:uncharacterized protein LOC116340409 [Contarinia nasturtii]